MKKYSPEEIEILKLHAAPGTFTKEDLETLIQGNGSIKLEYSANKVIEKYRAWEQKPISRKETLKQFIHKDTYARDMGVLYILKTALIKKGILTKKFLSQTEHELIAATWPDLCLECIHTLPDCKGKPAFAAETFADLEGELANKVIRCDAFEKSKQEGTC